MEKGVVILIIAIVISIIAFLSFYFNKKNSILRKLKKIKFSNITQLQSNELSKVSGKVLHINEPLVAPFSKRKCVAHIIKIEQKKSRGKNSYWDELVNQEFFQEFFLEKSGEVLLVKPTMAPKNYKTYLVEDRSVSSGFLNDPSPEFKKVLNNYNIDSETFLGFNKTLRYTERLIEVGEYITVAGIAKWKQIDETILPEYRYSKIAALESTVEQDLIITDTTEASDKAFTSNSVL